MILGQRNLPFSLRCIPDLPAGAPCPFEKGGRKLLLGGSQYGLPRFFFRAKGWLTTVCCGIKRRRNRGEFQVLENAPSFAARIYGGKTGIVSGIWGYVLTYGAFSNCPQGLPAARGGSLLPAGAPRCLTKAGICFAFFEAQRGSHIAFSLTSLKHTRTKIRPGEFLLPAFLP